MTDEFEESLRESLANAVPTPPEEPGRAVGARAYARRVRRTRAVLAVGVAAAVVAAVVVIPSVIASPDDHTAGLGTKTPHVRTPLVMPPVAHPYDCPDPRLDQISSPLPRGVVPPGAVLARLCAIDTGSANWSAPPEPLVTGVSALASELNGLRVGSPSTCTPRAWPAFALTFQYPDGHTISVEGSVGDCDTVSTGSVLRWGGTALVRDYLGALHDQRAHYLPPEQATLLPGCPPDTRDVQPLLVDGRGPGLVSARVCSYSYPAGPNPSATGVLSPDQVTMLNVDLAAHASRHQADTRAVRTCEGEFGDTTVLSILGQDAWGDRIELSSLCSVYTFMDRDGIWYWTPTQQTSAMLESVLRPVPHPTGRVSGRLLATGGVQRDRPLLGHVTLTGRQTASLMAGDDGRFGGSLQPGRYRIVGYSPLYIGGKAPCHPLHPFVTVHAGQTVHVSVYCQEK